LTGDANPGFIDTDLYSSGTGFPVAVQGCAWVRCYRAGALVLDAAPLCSTMLFRRQLRAISSGY
jgi:hypothetical protein